MQKRVAFLSLVALMLTVVLQAAPARADLATCYPKVDNFIFFVDQSGSMYQKHSDAGEIKETLAKKLAGQINDSLPEYIFHSSLYMFAPFESKLDPYLHWHQSMKIAIDSIADGQAVALRLTTMADGFDNLKPVIAGMKGKTAVIMFSDGGANSGGDPVAAAREALAGRPDVTLDVISFADSQDGRELNQQLSRIAPGSIYAEGPELVNNQAKREQFVRAIFCTDAPAKVARKLVLRGVNFDFNKSTIRPDARPVLDEAVQTLKQEPKITVSIQGHTDAIGSDAYNKKLSERRAVAVADYLHAGGIASGRMSTVGMGKSQPVATNKTAEGRAQNRRVEFKISE